MINFKEEINEFEPLLEIEKIEGSIKNDGFNDLLDMLSHITIKNDNESFKE